MATLTAKKPTSTNQTPEILKAQAGKGAAKDKENMDRLHVKIHSGIMTRLKMRAATTRASQQDIVNAALDAYLANE